MSVPSRSIKSNLFIVDWGLQGASYKFAGCRLPVESIKLFAENYFSFALSAFTCARVTAEALFPKLLRT